MKKNKFLPIIALLLVLSGCKKKEQPTGPELPNFDSYQTVQLNETTNSNELGDFSLVSPATGSEIVKDLPTFKWESSNNATSYILEVSNDENFINDEDTVYIKKTNICATEFTLDTYLRVKEVTYYWRVTAVNKKYQKLCSDECRTFFIKSPDYGEINFDIDYKEDWEVHKEGAQCNVNIDKTDFFNTGVNNSLEISFDETQTNRGVATSDGWMVVTHNQETELYGVDAFYFNFYYNGQDADVLLRVIDEDNEYYHAHIKLANNAQQTIIMKFDEFELRTQAGTPVANGQFDYHYIKGIEIVFEKTFGDGVCYISNLKAIKYEDYKFLFIDEVDFNTFNENEFIFDNYNGFTTQTSNDGKEFTVSYSSNIQGYGFVKIPVEKTLVTGDSFTLKFSHTGNSSNRILLRVIEEDGDRWMYRQKCSAIVDKDITIPFNAFTLSEANGNGAREFYYIKQLQIGIENAWESGSLSISNMRVSTLEDEVDDLYVNHISSDGTIETFEQYQTNSDLYYRWQNTINNKDEAMAMDNQYTSTGNGYSGKFTYKSDMYPACYGIQLAEGIEGFNAVSFEALDKSVLKNDGTNKFAHLENAAAKAIITLYVSDGSTYSYTIDGLEQVWTRYIIPFDQFRLDEGFSIYSAKELNSENLRCFAFGLQFYYLNSNGTSNPQYTQSNPVYMDNIKLTNSLEFVQEDVITKIVPSSNENVALVDDFNDIENEDVLNHFGQSDASYSKLTIVDGYDSKALCLQYKGNSESVSYSRIVSLDSAVKAKAIQFDMKGDGKATVYINLYFDYAGVSYKYRATLNNVSDSWNTYTIGFDPSNFVKVEGTGNLTINMSAALTMSKITIGIVNYQDYNLSNIYIDNVKLTSDGVSYTTRTVTAIGDE